ncbi:hypothetical protein Scep_012293 [Stephania cephalantha]|uniref:Uncharacterized protein n=1 Tax=Stephania cephalantha TaxID=152367 RepID=A0AAP0JGU9_9MAGN
MRETIGSGGGSAGSSVQRPRGGRGSTAASPAGEQSRGGDDRAKQQQGRGRRWLRGCAVETATRNWAAARRGGRRLGNASEQLRRRSSDGAGKGRIGSDGVREATRRNAVRRLEGRQRRCAVGNGWSAVAPAAAPASGRRRRRQGSGGGSKAAAACSSGAVNARWRVIDRSDARFRRNRDDAMEGLRSRVSGAQIETRARSFEDGSRFLEVSKPVRDLYSTSFLSIGCCCLLLCDSFIVVCSLCDDIAIVELLSIEWVHWQVSHGYCYLRYESVRAGRQGPRPKPEVLHGRP